jgi:hypothetical protein
MNTETYGYLVGLAVALVVAGALYRGATRFGAELVAGVGAVCEDLSALRREIAAGVAKVSELQAPNAMVTRLAELETKVTGAQLTVADVAEKFTALANRISQRQSRAAKRDAILDEEDEDEPVTEQERQEALAALAGKPGNGQPQGDRAPGPRRTGVSGWDRVRRAAAARSNTEGSE